MASSPLFYVSADQERRFYYPDVGVYAKQLAGSTDDCASHSMASVQVLWDVPRHAPHGYAVFAGLLNALIAGDDIVVGEDFFGRSSRFAQRESHVDSAPPRNLVPRFRFRDAEREGEDAREQNAAGQPVNGRRLFYDLLCDSSGRIGVRTSGTTGRPKLIYHRPKTMVRGVRVGPRYHDDVWALGYDALHFGALQVLFQAVSNHNPIIDLNGVPSDQALEVIGRYGVTRLSGTPSFLKQLTATERTFESVVSVTAGGEMLSSELVRGLQGVFPMARIHNVYAATEFGTLLTTQGDVFEIPREKALLIRIDDEGQLHVHRSLLADSIKCESEYFATGDLVEIQSESPLQFRFTGRQGDWINVGGFKVNPHKVEQVVEEYDGMKAACVFAIPNSVLGNIVACEVEPMPGVHVDQAALKKFLTGRLGRYEMPQFIEIVESISITRSGKKRRKR